MTKIKEVLSKAPVFDLIVESTPLHRLSNLEKSLDYKEIFIKRDDMTGLGPGGNKLRSLEFIIGEAKASQCDIIIVGGPVQSNFCTLAATACAKAGIQCILVHNGDEPIKKEGNLLLNHILGVESHFIGKVDSTKRKEYEEKLAKELENQGHHPYIAKNGATTGVGALGYVKAIDELVEQCQQKDIKIDAIYAPGGNGGVATGLIVGNALSGFPFEINIISVEYDKEELVNEIKKTIKELEEYLNMEFSYNVEEISNIIDGYRGKGWGENTEESEEEIYEFAKLEGIFLENIYNSKVMVGLKDIIKKGEAKGNVCYLHTGGFGSLFSQY